MLTKPGTTTDVLWGARRPAHSAPRHSTLAHVPAEATTSAASVVALPRGHLFAGRDGQCMSGDQGANMWTYSTARQRPPPRGLAPRGRGRDPPRLGRGLAPFARVDAGSQVRWRTSRRRATNAFTCSLGHSHAALATTCDKVSQGGPELLLMPASY